MAKRTPDPAQMNLFAPAETFPVREVVAMKPADDLKRQVAVMMGEAIRSSGKTAPQIAAEMTALLVNDVVTTAQLNAYTAQSRLSHTISVIRFQAFVRATGCTWLWDFLIKDDGLLVLQGEEAMLAEAMLLELRADQLKAKAKYLRASAPLEPSFRTVRT